MHLKKSHKGNARRNEKARKRKAAEPANISLKADMEKSVKIALLYGMASIVYFLTGPNKIKLLPIFLNKGGHRVRSPVDGL